MSEVRLIDANALAKELERVYLKKEVDEVGEEVYKAVAHIYSTILCMPTIDAEPVRHAHWVYYKNMGYFCSACIESGLSPTNANDNCGYSLDGTMNYCWNCGAKMDGEVNNE